LAASAAGAACSPHYFIAHNQICDLSSYFARLPDEIVGNQ
jgi:hypothetical protein